MRPLEDLAHIIVVEAGGMLAKSTGVFSGGRSPSDLVPSPECRSRNGDFWTSPVRTDHAGDEHAGHEHGRDRVVDASLSRLFGKQLAASLGPGDHVDDLARRLGFDAAWHRFRHLQPAGRATRRGQGGIDELFNVDGAASAGFGHSSAPANVFGGIADLAAPWVSRTFSDG